MNNNTSPASLQPNQPSPPASAGNTAQTNSTTVSDGQLYFDGKAYWKELPDGDYGQICREDARLHIGIRGRSRASINGAPSEVDKDLFQIQRDNRICYAGPLCGREPGLVIENGYQLLVTRGPTLIEPAGGDSPTLNRYIANLFGEHAGDSLATKQRMVFISWLKLAREAVANPDQHKSGQALALVGPPDCGKSLLQSLVITPSLGGRVADPGLWMTGGTNFNADLWGAEHLAIGDKSLGEDARARAKLRDEIKRIVASPDYPLHGKYREALTLRPVWRMTISGNDDPESATSLPALDAGFEDKIIYLKCFAPPAPFFDENDPDAKTLFAATLRSELPAYLREVDGFTIPADLVKGRFGVREFHHPDILDLLQDSSPLVPLGEILSDWIETWDATTLSKELSSVELYAALDAHLLGRFRPISTGPSHLGHQMARLACLEGWKGRITRKERRQGGRTRNQRQTVWAIRAEVLA